MDLKAGNNITFTDTETTRTISAADSRLFRPVEILPAQGESHLIYLTISGSEINFHGYLDGVWTYLGSMTIELPGLEDIMDQLQGLEGLPAQLQAKHDELQAQMESTLANLLESFLEQYNAALALMDDPEGFKQGLLNDFNQTISQMQEAFDAFMQSIDPDINFDEFEQTLEEIRNKIDLIQEEIGSKIEELQSEAADVNDQINETLENQQDEIDGLTEALKSKVKKDGDTMEGALIAAPDATIDIAQCRNIYAGTSGMTPNSTALATGTVYLQYE